MSLCTSNLQGFDGCEGEARERSSSCQACYKEYSRRSSARDYQRRIERGKLNELLAPMAEAKWEDKPKIRVTFGTILGANSVEGKVWGDSRGIYILLKQRNSSRGPIISNGVDTDALRVEVLAKNGEANSIWQASAYVGIYTLEGKQLADSLEGVNA